MDVSEYTSKWEHFISHERSCELFHAAVEGLFEINKFRTISALSVKSEIFSVMAQRMTSRLRMGALTPLFRKVTSHCALTAPALFSQMIWEVNINNNDLAVIS